VESFRDEPADVTVLASHTSSLTDLVSGEKLGGSPHKRRHPAEPDATAFSMTLPAHSYRVFDVN